MACSLSVNHIVKFANDTSCMTAALINTLPIIKLSCVLFFVSKAGKLY